MQKLNIILLLLLGTMGVRAQVKDFQNVAGPYPGPMSGFTSEESTWDFNPQKIWEIDKAGDEDFGRPGEPRIGAKGILYVHDFDKRLSYIFDPQGKLIKEFAHEGEDEEVSRYINCFTFREYVVIGAMDKLHFYTSGGELIQSVPNNIFGRFPLAFFNKTEYLVAPGAHR